MCYVVLIWDYNNYFYRKNLIFEIYFDYEYFDYIDYFDY